MDFIPFPQDDASSSHIPDSPGDRAALRAALLAQTPERSIADIAADVRVCAQHWEPEARILGNVLASDLARLCDAVDPHAPTIRVSGTPSPEMATRILAGAAENALRAAELEAARRGLDEDRATLEREADELTATRRALAALAGAQRRQHEDWKVARFIWCLCLAFGTVLLVLAARMWGRGG